MRPGLEVILMNSEAHTFFAEGGTNAQMIYIDIAHGKILPHPEPHTSARSMLHLRVVDAGVALSTALALLERITNHVIAISPLGHSADAPLWRPQLARLRVRAIRSDNRLVLAVDPQSRASPPHAWLMYNID